MQRWTDRGPWLNVALLFAIVTLVALGVRITAMQLILRTVVANERGRLAQAAEIQAQLLEARSGQDGPWTVPGAGKQFGETGEVVYARLEGDRIEFLTDANPDGPSASLPASSDRAEPIRRALDGQTGTVIGPDHRGERVIAAYHPGPESWPAVVAKIDLAEVRGYIWKSNPINIPATLGIIALGGVLFALAGRPLQRRALGTEHRFSRLVETMTEGVGITDSKGILVYANDRYAETVGRSKEQLVGRPLKTHIDLPEHVVSPHLLADGAGSFELSPATENGVERNLLFTLRSVEDRRDGESGAVVVLTDITELRRAQNRALEEVARAQRYLDIADVIFVVLDVEGRVVMVNRYGHEILGYDEGELTGTDWFAVCVPECDRAEARAIFERLLASALGTSEYYEIPILTQSGESWLISWHHTILDNPDGTVSGTLSSGVDVTERRRAEDALRVSKNRYRALFENAALGIYRTTPDGRILATNRTALKMLGFDSFDELADRNLEAEGYEPSYSRDEYRRRIERDGEITGFESAWIRKDGSTMYVRENARAVHDANGEIAFYEGTIEDISAEKEAERARRELEAHLIQTQKLESIGTLASGVAHEINNPLTGVINYAELIRNRIGNDRLRDYAQRIIEEGTRVANIVKSLLSFSRQDGQHQSPASMSDIVDSTLSLIGSVLERDQIRLTVEVPPDLPLLNCRSQQIQQVLINLLNNARDALNRRYPTFDENKTLHVRADLVERGGEPWIRTVVEDHGCGIPGEIVDRIFDPFFSTKPRESGTGLGLSISYGLVLEHSGRLLAESEPNAHTRFIMELPVDPDGAPSA